jgi:hypothetical protein
VIRVVVREDDRADATGGPSDLEEMLLVVRSGIDDHGRRLADDVRVRALELAHAGIGSQDADDAQHG